MMLWEETHTVIESSPTHNNCGLKMQLIKSYGHFYDDDGLPSKQSSVHSFIKVTVSITIYMLRYLSMKNVH